MQASSVALSTLNRLTNAVLDESRLILVPLSSILESFCEEFALPRLRIGSIVQFSDETQNRFSTLLRSGNKPSLKKSELLPSWIQLQKSQTLSSTRLSAVDADENGRGNQKVVSDFGSYVVHLNEKKFDEFIKDSPLVAVLYHAAWCKMCKILKPVWRSVSEECAAEKLPASLAAVDVTANPDLSIREKISHLPAVKLYGRGSFLRNVPTPISHKEMIEIIKTPMKEERSEAIAVLEGDNQSAEALEQMKIVSEKIKDTIGMSVGEVCCDDNANICTQLGVFQETIPHVRYFHFLMKKQFYYSADFSSSSLLDFMRTSANAAGQGDGPKAPDPDSSRLWTHVPNREHVILLNDATFDRALEIQPQLLVMFYAAWCRHCALVKPVFADAAAELSKLGYPKRLAACELVANSRVSQLQNIEFVPSFRLFENGKVASDHQSLRTKEDIVKLIVERNKPEKK